MSAPSIAAIRAYVERESEFKSADDAMSRAALALADAKRDVLAPLSASETHYVVVDGRVWIIGRARDIYEKGCPDRPGPVTIKVLGLSEPAP